MTANPTPYPLTGTTLPSPIPFTFYDYPWTINITCPKCKRQISYLCNDPYTFCPYCGARLTCPHCGEPLSEDC